MAMATDIHLESNIFLNRIQLEEDEIEEDQVKDSQENKKCHGRSFEIYI